MTARGSTAKRRLPLQADGKALHGHDDLRPFIAMEFIDGETLEDRARKGPMPLAEVVRIVTQVAKALEAAHEKDIVHRDIKSANIMITAKGNVKVLDFGLAQTAASTKLTRMGSTLGTGPRRECGPPHGFVGAWRRDVRTRGRTSSVRR